MQAMHLKKINIESEQSASSASIVQIPSHGEPRAGYVNPDDSYLRNILKNCQLPEPK